MSDAHGSTTIVKLDRPVLCPNCGHLLEARLHLRRRRGEVGICLYCSALVRWHIPRLGRPRLERLTLAEECAERILHPDEIRYWLHLAEEFHDAREREEHGSTRY